MLVQKVWALRARNAAVIFSKRNLKSWWPFHQSLNHDMTMWSQDDYCSSTSGISLSACEWRMQCEKICAIELSCHRTRHITYSYFEFESSLQAQLFLVCLAELHPWKFGCTQALRNQPGRWIAPTPTKRWARSALTSWKVPLSCAEIRWDFRDGVSASSNRVIETKKA